MDKIFITKPFLPPKEEYEELLYKIWEDKQITNDGYYLKKFEKELAGFLGVRYLSIVNNATTGLILAQKALNFKNKVITSPFSFIATSNSIIWASNIPKFLDVEPVIGNIDVNLIDKSINESTGGILAVHNYGIPGEINRLNKISKKKNIPIIYDAAPAFGVRYNNDSILKNGDASVVSFHGTKVFTTGEGGAVVTRSKKVKEKIDQLKNFSIINQSEVNGYGLNGKMNEFQAALGLLQLKYFAKVIKVRKKNYNIYKSELSNYDQLRFIKFDDSIKYNYAYCPLFFDVKNNVRDKIFDKLNSNNIFLRKYWSPLITDHVQYNKYTSSSFPIAKKLSQTVLCLPIYYDLKIKVIEKILNIIRSEL